MFEHVSSLCAHLRQCVCPVQPLHIPGNTNINSYFFFPGMPVKMVIVNCWIITEDMTGLLKDVWYISNMLGCCS